MHFNENFLERVDPVIVVYEIFFLVSVGVRVELNTVCKKRDSAVCPIVGYWNHICLSFYYLRVVNFLFLAHIFECGSETNDISVSIYILCLSRILITFLACYMHIVTVSLVYFIVQYLPSGVFFLLLLLSFEILKI